MNFQPWGYLHPPPPLVIFYPIHTPFTDPPIPEKRRAINLADFDIQLIRARENLKGFRTSIEHTAAKTTFLRAKICPFVIEGHPCKNRYGYRCKFPHKLSQWYGTNIRKDPTFKTYPCKAPETHSRFVCKALHDGDIRCGNRLTIYDSTQDDPILVRQDLSSMRRWAASTNAFFQQSQIKTKA